MLPFVSTMTYATGEFYKAIILDFLAIFLRFFSPSRPEQLHLLILKNARNSKKVPFKMHHIM